MKKLCFLGLSLFLLTAITFPPAAPTTDGLLMTAKEFKKIKTLADFSTYYKENSCPEKGQFSLVRVAHKQDPVEVVCRSFKCSPKMLNLIQQASVGDIYYLEEVTTTCDNEEIKLVASVFRIDPE